ncbi:MAG: maleylpyruvate isomerase N-terminal domain-containing protein [Caldilineaceae bacterium]|nr:maleylpyruvate isomerase N-terminal domain-containing protein [Caldilineaceae bacterium]
MMTITTTTQLQTAQLQTVQELSNRFVALNQAVLAFVRACSPTQWQAITAAEGWPVGVTARHIAVAHYPVIEWVRMIVNGQPLPPVTMDNVDQLNAQHAESHALCTQEEVCELLATNSANVVAYLQSLPPIALAGQGYLKLFESEISAEQLFVAVLLDGVANHFNSIKAAV